MYSLSRKVKLLSCLLIAMLLSTSPQCVPSAVAKPSRSRYKKRHKKRPAKATQRVRPRKKQTPAKPLEEATPTPPPASKPPLLKKPKLLPPVVLPYHDPLAALDALMIRQHADKTPYVPWIQTIGLFVDYSRVAATLWNRLAVMREISKHQESWCEGGGTILFRKNIQLSGTWGYNQLVPTHITSNNAKHTVQGIYARLGLGYLAPYDLRNNLYIGLNYARSLFTISTTGSVATQKSLQAGWWEVVIGSEHQLLKDWEFYAGLTLCARTNTLHPFPNFAPATNYVVPGYGRKAQSIVPSGTLYIKYQISFIEKQIKF